MRHPPAIQSASLARAKTERWLSVVFVEHANKISGAKSEEADPAKVTANCGVAARSRAARCPSAQSCSLGLACLSSLLAQYSIKQLQKERRSHGNKSVSDCD